MRFLTKHVSVVALTVLALGLGAGAAHADLETYAATLSGSQEVPANASTAVGTAFLFVDTTTLVATYQLQFSGLSSPQTAAHFHNAPAGTNGPVLFGLPTGSPINGTWSLTPTQYALVAAGSVYVNVHSSNIPGGEIRGQMVLDHVVGTEAMTFGAVKALFQ